MGKIDDKKQMKKDTLYRSSFELFTQKGFHKTSISDIVQKAGVAKGTFYLYFRDKFDVRNKLISHKSSVLFQNAYNALDKDEIVDFSEQLVFVVDHIINQLTQDKELLTFITKNLSWGVFKSALLHPKEEIGLDFKEYYTELIEHSPLQFENPEVMLYMIIELVSSNIYSSILYSEPIPIAELKPYLYRTIRDIIKAQATAPELCTDKN
ncbi:transcriptional regulator, TetR family [Lachnospiraceae bacterium KM106-2]|nr:transcriptional regulator, TetR family [Lachnospiraceae bacterium KM106-2]